LSVRAEEQDTPPPPVCMKVFCDCGIPKGIVFGLVLGLLFGVIVGSVMKKTAIPWG